MHRKLSILILAAAIAMPAGASAMTDAEVLAFAGKRTCKDGFFPYGDSRQVNIPILTLDPGVLYEFCIKLPKIRRKHLGILTTGLVELHTANLGNAACGTMSAWMIKTRRKSIFKNDMSPRTYTSLSQVAPNAVLTYAPGIWRVLFRYEEGCNRYFVSVKW